MDEILRRAYEERRSLLEALASALEAETREALREFSHVDRVCFRVKNTDSFLEKAVDPRIEPPYSAPLVEVEDQVAGRIIVFFMQDLADVMERLRGTFTTVESVHRRPKRDQEFGYESHHLICPIPVHLRPQAWNELSDLPNTFELQIRTVFMHAYSEPQHDLAYKGAGELPSEIRRQLAWIAASAWGADQAYRRVASWAARRELGEE